MKKSWPAWALLILSVAGICALTVWYYLQIRDSIAHSDALWAKRVSELLLEDRKDFVRWVEQLPTQASDKEILGALGHSDRPVAIATILNAKLQSTEKWINPSTQNLSQSFEPRLTALQLRAQQEHQPQMGPLVGFGKKFYVSAAVPLAQDRVLAVMAETGHPWNLLEEEARLWGLQCFVYNMDQRLIFASRSVLLSHINIENILHSIANKQFSGFVMLKPHAGWQSIATFHYDPSSEWIFVLARPVRWLFLPIVFFLLAFAGVAWLSQMALEQAAHLRRRHEMAELQQWARRVENYICGRDPALKDPPYPFQELSPILMALRLRMPQWQKAEAFPVELALERKLLGILIESLPEAILFFNAQGTLQLSNELGRVFFGMQQEAGREYKIQRGVQIPRGFLENFVEPVFMGAQPNAAYEVEVPWADGKYLYRIWVERVEEIEGQASGYIIVIRDITFRKNFDYVQEQLLSGITHDLRGPLSAVMGYLDLMKRQIVETGNQKLSEYLKLARDAGVRLTQMVSDILDVVRFEQGKIDIQVEPIRVMDIFTQLRTTFGVTADQKKISLIFEMAAPKDARTYGDTKLLERVFDNLLGNAIKFTPSGGKIVVAAQQGDKRMTFSISDTGRGIPREAQSRIFDKFQQVRPGDRSAGYGLGLSVVKFIVQAHKGDIRVESEVGAGSKFTFWIPDQPVRNPALGAAGRS